MEIDRREQLHFFSDNLPMSLHWQGLWHGEVVDAYIANKLNRGGRRIGFVRFEKEVDAYRTMERLNGLLVYGNKIFVGLAKYNARSSSWSRMKHGKSCGEVRENFSGREVSAQ
ncbi:hypothetical protein HRI_004895400 [Hibiscus trionum]|uniref:RRM domain-containing protein n=1 Tax=Hibiscus trionum TaxID=183268 RepID=A0A9W7JC19_HIBTR|nr:hypothetical protein HRI_004895400 [Hibiscus trionum]